MLDNSSSMNDNRNYMNGKKWDDLVNELKNFFEKLTKDDDLKLNSWVTIIDYNDKANN